MRVSLRAQESRAETGNYKGLLSTRPRTRESAYYPRSEDKGENDPQVYDDKFLDTGTEIATSMIQEPHYTLSFGAEGRAF